MAGAKKIYFISDFHLGAPDAKSSLERERKIVRFLDRIKPDAEELFVLGDLFDFWFEYRKVVPKGYVRILGKLAELSDAGIPIHFFVGNHDMWMSGYFEQELNIQVYHQPKAFERHGKKMLIGHGDGLGPGDYGYKFIKAVFRNRICRFLFSLLPPSAGIGMANYFSRKSRAKTGHTNEVFNGPENEWLYQYAKDVLQLTHYDYFIFGHRHLPMNLEVNEKSRYINLGDWICYYSYAEMEEGTVKLKYDDKQN